MVVNLLADAVWLCMLTNPIFHAVPRLLFWFANSLVSEEYHYWSASCFARYFHQIRYSQSIYYVIPLVGFYLYKIDYQPPALSGRSFYSIVVSQFFIRTDANADGLPQSDREIFRNSTDHHLCFNLGADD